MKKAYVRLLLFLIASVAMGHGDGKCVILTDNTHLRISHRDPTQAEHNEGWRHIHIKTYPSGLQGSSWWKLDMDDPAVLQNYGLGEFIDCDTPPQEPDDLNLTPEQTEPQTLGGGTDDTPQSEDAEPEPSHQSTQPPSVKRTVAPPAVKVPSLPSGYTALLVTEYMMRDFCVSVSHLPMWIEVFNSGKTPIHLEGYMLEIFAGRDALQKQVAETLIIGNIQVKPYDVVLLASKVVSSRNSTVRKAKVWVLNNRTNLKHGWRLIDADGNLIAEVLTPVLPPHRPKWRRVSHHRYKNTLLSDDYENTHYHGHPKEISTAGVHDRQPPKAPSLLMPMQIRKWVDLKKTQ